MNKTHQFLLLTVFLFVAQIVAGEKNGVLSGRVTDEQGNPLPYANVFVQENYLGTATDLKGKFSLRLPPGKYTLIVSYIGYKTKKETIELKKNEKIFRHFTLKSSAIQLGEITVTAEDEFIPRTPETKSVIRSAEIEHIQASSLNDVLQLVPGEKTENPNLHYSAEATIRGGNSIGTKVIMDGVPLSNNANLQTGIGTASGASGIDLRAIPAENIREVEVIRGIPSARHGDLVDGILLVNTRSAKSPFRLKFKYNPHLYETNFSGGTDWKNWIISGNFNLAYSERDIRITGDGYTRLSAQLSAARESEKFRTRNQLFFTRAFDESKEKPGYALREAWYNRDYNLKFSGNYFYKFSDFSRLNANYSVSFTRQNSYLQQLISRDNLVLSDRLDEGTQEGYIVFGSYVGKKWLKGEMWNLFADIYYQHQWTTQPFFHTFLAGITWRDDFNRGKGVVFDPLYPPILGTQAIRIRRYDELPAYNTVSFYAEDKINGRIIKPVTLQLGFRYEAYRPESVDFAGLFGKTDFVQSRNGSFFNPRINFSMQLFSQTQIRAGYGTTSKSPPMAMIFPGPEYFDVVDTVSVVDPTDPAQNFSLISTYIRDRNNANLRGYQQEKYEVSLDQQISAVGFSITGFYNHTTGMFRSMTIPIILPQKSFPDYPDLSEYVVRNFMFEDYNSYINDGWMKVKGVEFSLRTKRLPVIQTVFSFDAAYRDKKSGWTKETLGIKRYSPELDMSVIPFYKPQENYRKNLLLNYRFEIQARSLGIWVTLHIQQELMNIDGRNGMTDTLAIGYFAEDGNTYWISEAEQADSRYARLRRSYQPYQLLEEDRPNLWLFNLKVTKSLWKGAEVSFYVNNFFNYRPFYRLKRTHPNYPSYTRRNPELFFGVEMSTSLGVF